MPVNLLSFCHHNTNTAPAACHRVPLCLVGTWEPLGPWLSPLLLHTASHTDFNLPNIASVGAEVWETQMRKKKKEGGRIEEGCRKEREFDVWEKMLERVHAKMHAHMHGAHTYANAKRLPKHAPVSLFFRAAGAVSSCSPAMHARGLNHFTPHPPLFFSEEEPSKHMENITAGQEEVGEDGRWREEEEERRGAFDRRRSEVAGSVEERKKRLGRAGFRFPRC